MTKRQIADLVLANAGGGIPTEDLSVRMAEVIRLVAPAINYVTIADYRINRRMNQSDSTAMDRTADLSYFIGTYDLDVLKDSSRRLYYSPVAQGVADVPSLAAIETILPKGASEVGFSMIRSHVELIGVEEAILGTQVFAWIEKVNGEDRIYYKNLSPLVKKNGVVARMATNIQSVEIDEELPVPDHVIMDALQLLRDWFTGQRQMPEELVNNGKDDKR